MGKTNLMLLYFHLEVTAMAVCNKSRIWQAVWELCIYGFASPRLHLIDVCQDIRLENPIPMQLRPNCGTSLVRSRNRRLLYSFPDFLIGEFGFLTYFLDDVAHGALTNLAVEEVGNSFGHSLHGV